MKFLKLVPIILFISFLAIGCGSDPIIPLSCPGCNPGGYDSIDISGMAVITSIEDASEESYNCENNPVEVLFDFIPDDPLASSDYIHPEVADNNIRLTVGAGMNPPRNYMVNKGIVIGSTHTAIRQEDTRSMGPVNFYLQDIDWLDYGNYCWL